ncbi:hypothetical protein [Tellurirhabdus bombi]|uniref:hypothetical protein n=1 Tax=Tellurirhabdus bombi TaxID=2907205 RepID=UPI001F2219E6|nr:hypothetical protein [Tellurirhabdus bombi]
MNQVFNTRRFGLLVAKHWTEHRRQYGFSVFVLAGLMIVWYALLKPGYGPQQLLLILTILLGGGIHASTLFSELGNPSQGIGSLTLPASRLEKMLVAFLFSILFFPIALGLFYVITTPFLNYYLTTPDAAFYPKENVLVEAKTTRLFFGLYFFVHAVALLGSIAFQKQAFIKTTAVFFIAIGVTMYLNTGIATLLFSDQSIKDINSATPFNSVTINLDDTHRYPVILPESSQLLAIVFLGFVLIMLWYITFLKLKEKQI